MIGANNRAIPPIKRSHVVLPVGCHNTIGSIIIVMSKSETNTNSGRSVNFLTPVNKVNKATELVHTKQQTSSLLTATTFRIYVRRFYSYCSHLVQRPFLLRNGTTTQNKN